jgi:hypothetical protein
VIEAEAFDFPFVAALPKREKSRAVKRWEALQEYKSLCEKHGALIPQNAAADMLEMTHQRVSQIILDGRLVVIKFYGHNFITHDSLLDFAQTERKPGRPWNKPGATLRAQVKAGREVARIVNSTK